ncbi:TolC family protein [Maribacter litopenaei]|uniref:TolC family protein n=2 Tax=Maribacter litopenaei TaxID=2976127 RepID=A0ABY5YC15_9FLAO|nr:TolC family protein [Maribacter litopenaei]UWX56577.1 TolC family protein [Maribacter litopenaei]
MKIVQSQDSIAIAEEPILKVPLEDITVSSSPEISFYQNQIDLKRAEKNPENQQLLPDIGVEYFQGTNDGLNGNLHGYQLGLKIPLLFGGKASRMKSAKIAELSAEAAYTNYEIQLSTRLSTLKKQLQVLSNSLEYYENEGGLLSDEILKMANSSFQNGEIDFYQYIQSLESAYDVKLEYLNKLQEYNSTVIAINYLTL